MLNGKLDPTAGLASSGIAGTAPEKDDEENKSANQDEEMKDVSKKNSGMKAFSIDLIFVAFDLFNYRSHAVFFSIQFNL